MQNFSQRLEKAIIRAGHPKGDLAAHCGVALSTVSRWLAGSVPKAETLDMIAKFLAVDAKWLVFGGDDPWGNKTVPEASPIVREDAAPYNAKPLREPGEPTLQERFARMEEHNRKTLEQMAALKQSMDALMDLFGGKADKVQPPHEEPKDLN